MNKVGTFLLKNDLYAGLVALVLVLLPLLSIPTSFLAGVLVSWVTLLKGFKSGAVVLAWVALPALCFTFLHKINGYDILLMSCLWIWLLSGLLAQYKSWRLLLEVSVLLGVVVVIGMHLFFPDVQMFWMAFFKNMLSKVLGSNVVGKEGQMALQDVTLFIPYMTGMVFSLQLLGVLIQIMIARYLQLKSKVTASFSQEFSTIRLDHWMAILLLLLVVGLYFQLNVVMDMFPLMVFLFAFAGLSLLYSFKKLDKRWLYFIIFIFVLIVIKFLWAAFFLAGIAFVDVWFDLRQRMSSRT